MSYSENKSLQEYGDLNSMHHSDVQAERDAGSAQLALDNQPPFLEAHLLLGGSYVITWSRGNAEVPVECQGLWTGTSQANAAIQRCMARLTAEAAAAQEAELQADFEAAAIADIGEVLEAEEVAQFDVIPESQEEVEARADKEAEASRAEPEKEVVAVKPKATRKKSTVKKA